MKKQSSLLIAGALLVFASCQNETATTDDAQAKIDSMVNERLEQLRMDLAAKNDSIIMEMAIYRADSIIAARTGQAPPANKPKPRVSGNTTTRTEEAAAEEKPKDNSTVGDIKSRSDENKESATDRFKKKSDQNQESTTDRFKKKSD